MIGNASGGRMETPDVVLIGGGIMSATLGTLLRRLKPEWTLLIIEALPKVALESSHAWNNAGTGHAALCELNYTSEDARGKVNISKAVRINEEFETSKHFWAYLVEQGVIADPTRFIKQVPHMSFVRGEEDQAFLKRRYEAMRVHPFFSEMAYTTDHETIQAWSPLLMEGRPADEPVAATRIDRGTDVNYGELTRTLMGHLVAQEGVELVLDTQVRSLKRTSDGRWQLKCTHREGGRRSFSAAFAFIGAGGGALELLQKSGLPEGKGFGGFPVSGKFLICQDEEIIQKHAAKVYGKAAVGAPPMSVPHLDTRSIDGRRTLLFGPFAGFSPKFLKRGSYLDLLKSVRLDNLFPMLAAGRDNMPLTLYLMKECMKSHQDRCEGLRAFFPAAAAGDWKLLTAGQRVQIIKKDAERTGRLQFGTEVVAAADGSLAAVLGASPGASTAVSILLRLLQDCFPEEMASAAWKQGVAEMVPAYGKNMANDVDLYEQLCARVDRLLQIGVTS